MDEPNDLIPLEDAAKKLGVARGTLWKRVRELDLPVYTTLLDRRKRLLSWELLQEMAKPTRAVVVASPAMSSEYDLDDVSQMSFQSATGMPLTVIPGERYLTRYELLKKRSIDTFTGASSAVAQLIQAERDYAVRDAGPFPIRDWYPEVPALVASGFVARRDSAIKSIWDIGKGTRLADVSALIPGMKDCYAGLLAWLDLKPNDVAFVRFEKRADSVQGLFDGKVDVAYSIPTSEMVFDLASRGQDLVWLDMNPNASERDAKAAARHMAASPTLSFIQNREGVASAAGFWGHLWLGRYNGRFVHAEAREEFVYSLARWRTESPYHAASRELGEHVGGLQLVTSALPTLLIPVHDGAVRYFRECGIWTTADDDRQQYNLERLERYIRAWNAAISQARAKKVRVHPSNANWIELWESCKRDIPLLVDVSRPDGPADL